MTYMADICWVIAYGQQVGSRPRGKGWAAISHGPNMLNTLILLAWVQGREVQTSFRYAT